MSAHWTAPFVGIPYRSKGRDRSGCDCWGLIKIVHGEAFGVTVPGYEEDYACPDELREVARAIGREQDGPFWEKVENPVAGDVILFRRGTHGGHVGLFVTGEFMLHMEGEDCSKIARHDCGVWGARKIGYYRWSGQ